MGLAENIKLLRLTKGLTQKELADIVGVSDKAVSTWESGSKEPRMGTIQVIADHFGILKSDLIEDDGIENVLYKLTEKAAPDESEGDFLIRLLADKLGRFPSKKELLLLEQIVDGVCKYLNADDE